MGKATGVLLAVLGFGTATYVMTAPDTERAASDKLATLVRIAAEGTRTVAQSGARSDRDGLRQQPRRALIADQRAADSSENETAPATASRKTDAKARLIISQAVVPSQSPSAGNDQVPRRSSVKPVDDEARRALGRSIQTELKRVGCFDGELDGAWNSATRASLKAFVERINASLPVDEPDYILLTLLQGHGGRVCGKDCPAGQLFANDGRCLPKAIVAQADRKVPQRATVAQSTVPATAPSPEAAARDRRADFDAQLRIAEEKRAKALIEAERRQVLEEKQAEAARQAMAARQAEIQAKADAERQAQLRAAEAMRQKNEAAAADAHRKQLALEEENRGKAEAQRAAQARLLDEQRTKAEAAAEEVRRRQLALAEQQRQVEARAAELQRAKAAAAEEARRRQLVTDQQQRSKEDAQRLALAVAAEDQRMKAAAALEEARRRQLVLEQRNPKNDAALPQAMASLSVAPQTTLATPPPASPVEAVPAPAEMHSVPFITGSTAPASSAPVAAAPLPPALVAKPAPAPVPVPVPKAAPQPQKAVRATPPRRNQDPAPRQQPQPRYVQRFVPPSYVGRTNSNPSPAPRAAYYRPSAPSYSGGGGNLFSNISRSAP